MMTFDEAITHMKNGGKVAKPEWVVQGSFLFIMPRMTTLSAEPPLLGNNINGTPISNASEFSHRTIDGEVTPWTAAPADIAATDWELVTP